MSQNVHGKYNLLFIMKKTILNLGKTLNKAEQKQINGGRFAFRCKMDSDCESIPSSTCRNGVCD